MYDVLVRLQALHREDLDLPAEAKFCVGIELHVILQCESLGHQVVVYQIVDAAGEELDADFEVPGVLGAKCECFGREAMLWNALESGREDGFLDFWKRWRFGVMLGVICSKAGLHWMSSG